MVSRGGRGRLSQGLDREVYTVVRKIIDEHNQYGDANLRLSFAQVYDAIKRSNSSLNRKNKKLLEDSVERVLETIHLDSDSDSLNGDFDGIDAPGAGSELPPSNRLNRSIVGMWSTSTTKREKSPRGELERQNREKSMVDSEPLEAKKRKQVNGEQPPRKRRGATKTIDKAPPTLVSLADLGGVDAVIQQFEELLVLPLTEPEIYAASKLQPPRGVLIHGPPGCGKTMIANAFAAEMGVNFISISAPSIVSGMSGESEKALRDHFEEAKQSAPCIVFIDEIDAITPKRESAQREMEKRIVAQLLICMDDLALEKTDGKPVIVLAATNRPDSLDTALRRGGRFDKEINMSVPSEPVREQILRALTRNTPLSDDVDFKLLAKRTPGFVGADLNDLVSTAGATALKRYLNTRKADAEATSMDVDLSGTLTQHQSSIPRDDISPTLAAFRRLIAYTKAQRISESATSEIFAIRLAHSDFLSSLPRVQPSALREGFATIPSTTFADIGALSEHRTTVTRTIINHIQRPDFYASFGITHPPGLLLWGPPGCGKTLLARAIANESRANFISVRGPELLNKYVGESERAVRQVFVRARSSVPVIIFFDELDALVPRRDSSGAGGGGGAEATSRVVNTLLTELDGVGSDVGKQGIYIIAATNRPEIIDPAMLRPGRLQNLLYVGLPSAEERVDILRTLCLKSSRAVSSTNEPFRFTEEMAELARTKCDGLSGADLESLLHNAGFAAIERGGSAIDLRDLEAARGEVWTSVGLDDMRRYERLREKWSRGWSSIR